MAIKHLNWAFEIELSAEDGKSVLIALANYADEDGFAWPSQETLARNTGLSERTIRRYILRLEELGYLKRQRRQKGMRRLSDGYTLNMEPDTVSTSEPDSVTGTEPDTMTATEPDTVSREPPVFNPQSQTLPCGQSLASADAPPKPPRKKRNQRPKDELFEVMVEACYHKHHSKLTKSERGRTNTALEELRSIGATPDDLRHAVQRYRTKYAGYDVTPQAITANWTAITSQPIHEQDLDALYPNFSDPAVRERLLR